MNVKARKKTDFLRNLSFLFCSEFFVIQHCGDKHHKARARVVHKGTALLAEKDYGQLTVQDIIDKADIGRTTFYAHFETKDFLLKDLCEELFGHIIDTAMGLPCGQYHCSYAAATDSVFLHLLRHLQENDRNILELLSSQNNEIFIRYFKCNLKKLIITQYADKGVLKNDKLPQDYLVDHISSSFVETVGWWISGKMKESPEQITQYFLAVIEPILQKPENG